MGALGFMENFEHPGGTAYTFSGITDIRNGLFKSQDYESYTTKIRIGPLYPFKDFDLGDRVGQQIGTIIHVDNITSLKCSYDENTPLTWEAGLGDQNAEEDPFARMMRSAATVWNFIGTVLGGTGLF